MNSIAHVIKSLLPMYVEIWRCQLILLSYGVSSVSIDTCSCMCWGVHSSTMYRYVTYLVYLMGSLHVYTRKMFLYMHNVCITSHYLLSRIS